jgi:predicted nucleic acid-binding protein
LTKKSGVDFDTNAHSAFADGDEKLLRTVQNEANLPLFDLLLIGRETARHYAEIRGELRSAGKPIPSNDIWIAALAKEYRCAVVSRDRHFEAIRGLDLFSW